MVEVVISFTYLIIWKFYNKNFINNVDIFFCILKWFLQSFYTWTLFFKLYRDKIYFSKILYFQYCLIHYLENVNFNMYFFHPDFSYFKLIWVKRMIQKLFTNFSQNGMLNLKYFQTTSWKGDFQCKLNTNYWIEDKIRYLLFKLHYYIQFGTSKLFMEHQHEFYPTL